MKINLDEFNKRVESGHIRKQTLDHLTIWNYTHKTQFDRAWDEYTTLARGLITEPDGKIHSRSFKKFFNLGEPGVVLPENETPEITLKMDGYLGLTYWHDGIVKVASRGSFQSEFARWATEWLRVHVPKPDKRFDPEFTYVFEILYPHKRIVVDNSGKYGLVLLAIIHNRTGEEVDRDFMLDLMYHNGTTVVPLVPVRPSQTIDDCVALSKALKGTECEGFIAHYRKSGIRVKIKGDDYCRIHRLATRLTSRMLWEILSSTPDEFEADQKIAEIVGILPPEYGKWVRDKSEQLRMDHDEICKAVARIVLAIDFNRIVDRKAQVEYAQKPENTRLFHLVMSFLSGNGKWDQMAWKMGRPEHEFPILRDGEDE